MSNLNDELANRGSKLCMQISVNNTKDDIKNNRIVRKSRKYLLDDKIGLGVIQWLSPLTSENFKEYQLNQIAEKIPHIKLNQIDWSFWPTRQPQWDAIGIAPDDTLVIVEAKAHISEFLSGGCNSEDPNNRYLIESKIKSVLGTDEVWMNQYYQTANRMVFLNELINLGFKVMLIYLCFVNDVSYIPEDKDTVWDIKLKEMYDQHPMPEKLKPFYKYVFIDIWREKGV
jgi:hypothetical protein